MRTNISAGAPLRAAALVVLILVVGAIGVIGRFGASAEPDPQPARATPLAAASPADPTSTGRASAPPAVPSTAAYPLKASANGRYLVDQRGIPFLLIGDSPQGMIGDLSIADADLFLADRKAAGFNAVWVNLLCNDYTGCDPKGNTFDGIAPFRIPGDLDTPNEAYFARADAIIRLAATYGIVVLLDPIETGGWMQTLRLNGAAKARAYGEYVGARYRSFPNIVWFNGNDFQSWRETADDDLVLAVANGIKAADSNHLQTVELDYFVSGSLDDRRWAPLIGLNAAYTYMPTYAKVLAEYGRPSFLPTFMVEANYEFEHDYAGPQTLRRQEYWAMLSGATGQLYGNKYTWQFLPDWKEHLDTQGAEELGHLTRLFAARPWYALVPDESHAVVISGYGTFSASGTVDSSDYVTAARTADGGLVIAYLPTARTITVDMRALSGRATARWFDPTRGTFASAAEAPLDNVGTHAFSPPGRNAEGDDDWVLVIEVAP